MRSACSRFALACDPPHCSSNAARPPARRRAVEGPPQKIGVCRLRRSRAASDRNPPSRGAPPHRRSPHALCSLQAPRPAHHTVAGPPLFGRDTVGGFITATRSILARWARATASSIDRACAADRHFSSLLSQACHHSPRRGEYRDGWCSREIPCPETECNRRTCAFPALI